MNNALDRQFSYPVPEKLEDWTRYLKTDRTLNDMVEEVHRSLLESNSEYRLFLNAVWDSEAVEGSLAIDNNMAALMIRDKARELKSEIASKKLDTIVKALNIVLRRYHASRKERRHIVDGQTVPTETNGE